LTGPLHQALSKTQQLVITQYSERKMTSRYSQHTLIQFFVRHHDSMLSDMKVGLMRSSSRTQGPPRLEHPVSGMGAEWSSAKFSIITSWTMT
jgi:hypothetical protein